MPRLPAYKEVLFEFSNPGQLLEGVDERHGGVFVPWIIPGVSAGDRVTAEFAFKGRKERFDMRASVRWVRTQGMGLMPAGVALDIHQDDKLKLRKLLVWGKGGEVQYFKRKHPRLPVDLPCIVAHGAVQADATLLDVSAGGAYIAFKAAELPSIGTIVELRLSAPGRLWKTNLKIPGKVAWLDFFQDSRGFGVQFDGSPPAGLMKLVERSREKAS